MKSLLLLIMLGFLQACTTGHCRHIREDEAIKSGRPPVVNEQRPVSIKTSSAERVRVFKFDGSQQCGSGTGSALSESLKDLRGLQVYQSWKRHDGMMRVQLCGTPTGQSNVYEIDRKNLTEALKLGFREWTLD